MSDSPELIVAEGDLVTWIFKRQRKDPKDSSKTYNSYWFDTFRIKDGKIVEHWDGATRRYASGAGMMVWIAQFIVAVLAAVVFVCGSLGAQSHTGHFAKVNRPLGEAETRGKGVFLRCSICHLPQLPGRTQAPGPVLDPTFKDTSPGRETVVCKMILEGSPRMPGFQHTLLARDIDDVIAYLKALKDL